MLNHKRSPDLMFQALADPARRAIVDRLSRSTISRRVGSASAWNIRSSDVDWLSIHLSIATAGERQP